MSFVTVANFSNAFNMNVVKGRLESEGIPAFAKDEHTIGVNPLYDNAVGGIKLQVSEEHEADARRILRDIGIRPTSNQPLITYPAVKAPNPFLQFIQYLFYFAIYLGLLYFMDNPQP